MEFLTLMRKNMSVEMSTTILFRHLVHLLL